MVWTPTWQASTAYSVKAVVIPTVFGGYTWRCTTAGTSGGSEPSWPADPSSTPTVTDGTVVWTVGTGFRQATHDGIVTLVQAFATANPTIIRKVTSTRPRSLLSSELPVFWVGDLSETISTGQGIRTRVLTGFSCFLADRLGEQIESDDRMAFVIDALTDLFTDNYHAISGRSNLQHIGTSDLEFDENGSRFVGAEFLFGQSSVAEGRT